MKIIYKIAKAELQSLFFSPIAWLILILYTFQTGMDFAGLVDGVMKGREMGYGVTNGTSRFFGGWDGVLTVVQGYLYLYIPLLTMNLMSRELGSGSIKLLYSSPVTNVQIILGKYLSMLIYALVLVGILVLYVIIGAISAASNVISLSNTASGSERSALQRSTASSHALPFGANSRPLR